MKIHILQHAEWETIGQLDKWITKNGYTYTTSHLYKGDKLPNEEADFLIVMGGPMGIYDDEKYPWLKLEREYIKSVVNSKTKVLGICLGSQFIADALGAKVYPGKEKEIGFLKINKSVNHKITDTIPESLDVFHWHGDTFENPKGAVNIFNSSLTQNQGFIYNDNVIAFQFHFEVGHKEIEGFIDNGRDEIIPSKYVQRESEIMSNNFDFDKANSYLFNILDNLFSNKI
jgi:GMP synthase (glutamine-hydrolysing)